MNDLEQLLTQAQNRLRAKVPAPPPPRRSISWLFYGFIIWLAAAVAIVLIIIFMR